MPDGLQLSVMQSPDDGSPGPMGHQMLQLAKLVMAESYSTCTVNTLELFL